VGTPEAADLKELVRRWRVGRVNRSPHSAFDFSFVSQSIQKKRSTKQNVISPGVLVMDIILFYKQDIGIHPSHIKKYDSFNGMRALLLKRLP
jgi:hypothetical protein